MSTILTTPVRHADLVMKPIANGEYVTKNPRTGSYFQLGPQEHFLFDQFDGKHTLEDVIAAYQRRFQKELTQEDLLDFIEAARQEGLLENTGSATLQGSTTDPASIASQPRRWLPTGQSLLYWRVPLFDPNRLMSRLEPALSFFWSKPFLVFSVFLICFSVGVAWANSASLVHHVFQAISWQGLFAVWSTLLLITTVHEFGHGLTCKRHGGEVHEVGLLVMYFMPCLYCNVSDAWLLGDKRKRMAVTLAGGYVELCIWAAAVLIWRLTVQDSFVNYLALSIITVSGFRVIFNFNPLMKLDGYYLLSDYLEIPNLRQRSMALIAAYFRWLMWGAPKPPQVARARALLIYGIACWFISIVTVSVMLHMFNSMLYGRIGYLGVVIVSILAVYATRGLFRGFALGEAKKMFLTRHKKLGQIVAGLGLTVTALWVIPWENRAVGTFEIFPLSRREVRAPVASFLKEVLKDEGASVSPSDTIARLEVPDLASRLARKQAEINEAEAGLRLLKEGARQEKIEEQRQRVTRTAELREICQKNLANATESFVSELKRLDKKVEQCRAELQQAEIACARSKELFTRRAISNQQYEEDCKKVAVVQAVLSQAMAEKASREAVGTADAVKELAKIEKEYKDEQGTLELLQLGPRTEEVLAEEARLARLREELEFLRDIERKLLVAASHQGLVVTPHVKEKVGQYLNEGDLICIVEETSVLNIEIQLPEDELRKVKPGQTIWLKARALPFTTFETKVERIAPSASPGEIQSTVVVHAQLTQASDLKPGLTGYARIYCGPQPIGLIIVEKAMQYIRTEFWW